MKRFVSYAFVLSVILISYHFSHAAGKGNKTNTNRSSSSTLTTGGTGKVGDTYAFRVNKVEIPINSKGVLGDVVIDGLTRGEYDGKGFLFSGGFMLSGLADTGIAGNKGKELWANAMASASRTTDYLSGTPSFPNDPNAQIYVISRYDPPFGTAWKDWRSAVALGADFYDGDNDGIYNPVDKNGNGKWDTNEDKPDFLGDLTAWCVYHDGVISSQRNWTEMSPRGIEIQQTIWGYQSSGAYGNVLFIRYRIISRGLEKYSGDMDSTYFSVWADPDLGDYTDDAVGCDTVINSGYVYNGRSTDSEYGANPPCFLMRFLQGPVTYIPGVTFTDNNANGIFDQGIDTPLKTAVTVNGSMMGIHSFPGAQNQPLSSIVNYVQSDPNRGDPEYARYARNYMLGHLKQGNLLDPCNDVFGRVVNQNCFTIDPLFWYSGDPVIGNGWLYNILSDVRLMQNTGPFQLKKNQPMDIIVGYVVGRGTDALNSITVAKENSNVTQAFLNSNFAVPSTVVETQVLSGGADLKIQCDGTLVNAVAVTATIKTTAGSTIGTLPLYDDGIHNDQAAGDKIFGNSVSVIAYQDPLLINVTVTSLGGTITEWPGVARVTTTSLPLNSFSIVADNLNNDGIANNGEIVRYVFSISNSSAFSFDGVKIFGSPLFERKILSAGSLPSGGTYSPAYDPTNVNSYLDFFVPTYLWNARLPVTLYITDNRNNIWYDTLSFPVYQMDRKYSSLQPFGLTTGKFSILVTNPSMIKNHLYVIRGVDSIDMLRTPGFMLKDSTEDRILLLSNPLPDMYGFNMTPVDGFKIFPGDIQYDLHASTWSFSGNWWFQSSSNASSVSLGCGAYLAPEFSGISFGAYPAGGSTISRSSYNAVDINFSRKTGFTDQNSNGLYDIGEPYTIDTTNLQYCQKAFFYARKVIGGISMYSGFKWIPFAVFDRISGQQLNVVILDFDNNGRWDIDGTTAKNNVAWIMASPYDPSGVTYDSTKGGINLLPAIRYGLDMPSMWVLWMKSNGLEPYGTQGTLTLTPTYPISSRNGFTFNPTVLVNVEQTGQIPTGFALEQNYPNPFNPNTTIHYSLPQRALVTLKVYNLLGQEVVTLENGIKNAGAYSVLFDGRNLASGIYFYRLQAGTTTSTRKLVLLK